MKPSSPMDWQESCGEKYYGVYGAFLLSWSEQRKLLVVAQILLTKYKQSEFNNWKGSYAMIKWDLFQGCRNDLLFASQSMWYTTLSKERIEITISVYAEKAFDKIHLFMMITLIKAGIQKTYLSIIKIINDIPRVNGNMVKQSFRLVWKRKSGKTMMLYCSSFIFSLPSFHFQNRYF